MDSFISVHLRASENLCGLVTFESNRPDGRAEFFSIHDSLLPTTHGDMKERERGSMSGSGSRSLVPVALLRFSTKTPASVVSTTVYDR